MQISRLFEMLYILQERGQATASELAARLEVSVRTVYRDAQALCEAGVPLYAQNGRGGGLRILPGYQLKSALLSEEERKTLLSALRAMEQVGAADAALLRRLTALLGGSQPDWVEIDFSDWSGQRQALFGALRTAILLGRQVALDYCAEGGESIARRVCPVKLWFKGRTWYLRAYCMERRAMRTFKLTRILRADMLPEGFPPQALCDAGGDADAWDAPEPLRFTLLADACMAYRVYDDFGPERVERLEGGGFRIRAEFPPGEWNVGLILSYGAHAEVEEPAWLRREIAARVRAMAARYGEA